MRIAVSNASEMDSLLYLDGKTGMNIIFKSCSDLYKSITIKDFEKWAYDKEGVRVNIYADIVNHIILNYWGSRCEYKSCLTKYISIE